MNNTLPSFLIGFTIGNLLFIGGFICWRFGKLISYELYCLRLVGKAKFCEDSREASQPMRCIAQIAMLWDVFTSRWNHLTKPHINQSQNDGLEPNAKAETEPPHR